MILSDSQIRQWVVTHDLINPFYPDQLQPASYDVKLGAVAGDRWVVRPGEFKLASTMETVNIPPELVGVLDGKSTLARHGLVIHLTAGYLDPGFHGQVTLEMVNMSVDTITLERNQLIGQVRFHQVHGKVERPYGSPGLVSHYQGQTGPTPAAW